MTTVYITRNGVGEIDRLYKFPQDNYDADNIPTAAVITEEIDDAVLEVVDFLKVKENLHITNLRGSWYELNYDPVINEIEREARLGSTTPDYTALDAAVDDMKLNIYPYVV